MTTTAFPASAPLTRSHFPAGRTGGTSAYAAIRALLRPGDGMARLSQTHTAIFWPRTVGIRLLLFKTNKEGVTHLIWTQWCENQTAALLLAHKRAE